MVRLYQGDCLVEMDKMITDGVMVDSIITDPPYGMSFQSYRRKEKYDAIENDKDLSWLDDFVEKAYMVANDNTAHYVFCSFHNIDIFKQAFEKKFKIKNILVWEKNNTSMGDLKGDFAPKIEFILFMHKGRRLINGRRDPNIFKFARTGNKFHPTEKPVDMMEYLIEKFTDVGDIVFDPFMGSGTTGVASVNKSREFIGIELDSVHYQTANMRINDALSQLERQDMDYSSIQQSDIQLIGIYDR